VERNTSLVVTYGIECIAVNRDAESLNLKKGVHIKKKNKEKKKVDHFDVLLVLIVEKST
jgi:hypothetical protein